MKTLKKLFSVSAIVALLGTLAPMYAFGANYSDELTEAYTYAYTNGITTMKTIDAANMYGNVTRIEMAKMIANYALNVLKMTPDTSAKCEFTDVTAALDEKYGNGVTNACQLGLMGQNITAFRPNDPVTRAEFGTTLSRALNHDSDDLAAMNAANPYYKDHLNFLKGEGIMNQIDNPSMPEVRGYVMLMMMRADDSYQPAEGCTLEERVACLLGDNAEACLAACEGEEPAEEEQEVKAGTLTVSMGDALADGTQIPGKGMVSFGTVKFKASSEDVNLKSVTIEKKGLANLPNGTKVWFEQDGVRMSSRATFNSDGEAVVSFAPAYTVKANKTAEFDLYVLLDTAASYDIAFASKEFDTTAERVNGSFTTPTLRTTDYEVIEVDLENTSAGGKAISSTNGYELATFTIENNGATNNTKVAIFKSITLRQAGTANLDNIGDVVLERDGEIVSTDYSIDGKYLTVKVNNNEIENGATATYILRAAINAIEENDTYNFFVKNEEDVNVVEKTTNFRATNDTFDEAANNYTVEGGDVTLTRDTSVDLDSTVAPGSRISLLKGTMTTKESVTIENIEDLTYTLNGADDLSKLFSTLYLKIGSSTFSHTTTADDDGTDPIEFEGTAVINGKVNVELYGTLKSNADQGATLLFDTFNSANFDEIYYTSNEVDVTNIIGSIQGINVTIEETSLNVNRTDGLGTEANVAKGEDVTLYKATLSSQQSKGARITALDAKILTNDNSFKNNTTVTLYVNDSAVATRTFDKNAGTNSIIFNGLNAEVNSKTNATIELKVNFAEGVLNGKKFQVTAASEITYTDLANGKQDSKTIPVGASLVIADSEGTVTLDKDAVNSQLFVKGEKDVELVNVKVNGEEGSVRLYDLVLDANSVANISNVRLADLSGNVIATATSLDGDKITFTRLSNTTLVEKDNVVTYKVIADINDNVVAGDLTISILAAGATTLRTSNGTTLTTNVVTEDVVANTHRIDEKSLVVTQVAGITTDLNTNAMRFTVKANGGDITLTALDLNLVTSVYENTDAVIYRTSVSDANEVILTPSAAVDPTAPVFAPTEDEAINAEKTYYTKGDACTVVSATCNGTNVYTAVEEPILANIATYYERTQEYVAGTPAVEVQNNVVSKGTTATFIVTYPDATLKDTAQNNNWTLSLKDITVDGLGSVKGFTNVATFPFTTRN